MRLTTQFVKIAITVFDLAEILAEQTVQSRASDGTCDWGF